MTSNSVTFRVGQETFQTSYRIFGDLKAGTRPLVVLNGGPGIPHWYLLPHADLHKTHGQPVVLYDQLGTGESTRVHDKPAGFFTPALFVAELDNLIRHLRIGRDFDLLGRHARIEYIAARRPQVLKHLVLTNLEVWPLEATKTMMHIGEAPTVYRAMYVRSSFPASVLILPAAQFPNLPLRTVAQARRQ